MLRQSLNRQRRRRTLWLAILATLALVAPVALSATANAAETPSTAPLWHAQFTGIESANLLADTGGLTIQPDIMSFEAAQPLYQRMDTGGATTWSVNDLRTNYNVAVADLAGNLFEIKTDYTNGIAAPILRLRTPSGVQWSTSLSADSADASLALGNNRVYVMPNSRVKTVLTINAANGTQLGTVNLPAGFDARTLSAYDGGAAAISLTGVIGFLGVDGQLQHQYASPNSYSLTEASAVTATGVTYVVVRNTNTLEYSLARFMPADGLSWIQPLPAPLNDSLLSDYRLAATSDGGAVVGVNGAQWPDIGTAPGLAKFTAAGANSWIDRPGRASSDTSSNQNPNLVALEGTSSGGLIVGTNSNAACAASPFGCNELDFNFYNSATGSQIAPLAQLGSLATSENYEYFSNPLNVTLAAQTHRLYVSTRRSDANLNHSADVLAFATTDIGTSYPETAVRATVTIGNPTPTPTATTPTPAPTPSPSSTRTSKSAVFLGDSYSSGEGAPAIVNGQPQYIAGTNQSDNHCHRSTAAYGPRIGETLSSSYQTRFHACSGALIADFYSPFGTNHKDILGRPQNPAEIPQLSWLTRDTQLVALTVSGNDVGFPDVMLYCATRAIGGSNCKSLYGKLVQQRISQIRSTKVLQKLYRDIRNRSAQGAKILVLSYPRFFPAKPPITCPTGAGTSLFVDTDMRWINDSIKELNATIKQAATETGVTYVNAYTMLAGHELCTKDPWLNRVTVFSGISGSFHPKVRGQRAYFEAAKPYLK